MEDPVREVHHEQELAVGGYFVLVYSLLRIPAIGQSHGTNFLDVLRRRTSAILFLQNWCLWFIVLLRILYIFCRLFFALVLQALLFYFPSLQGCLDGRLLNQAGL